MAREANLAPVWGAGVCWGPLAPRRRGQGPNVPYCLGTGARAYAECALAIWLKLLPFVTPPVAPTDWRSKTEKDFDIHWCYC